MDTRKTDHQNVVVNNSQVSEAGNSNKGNALENNNDKIGIGRISIFKSDTPNGSITTTIYHDKVIINGDFTM